MLTNEPGEAVAGDSQYVIQYYNPGDITVSIFLPGFTQHNKHGNSVAIKSYVKYTWQKNFVFFVHCFDYTWKNWNKL